MQFIDYLTTFFALPRCMSCLAYLSDTAFHDALCQPCTWSLLPWPDSSCEKCGVILEFETTFCGPCRLQPGLFEKNRAAFIYGGPIQQAILTWKKPRTSEGRTRALADLALVPARGPDPEIIHWVPIPPNPTLQRGRNFLPARALALQLSRFHPRVKVLDVLEEQRRTTGRRVQRTYTVRGKSELPDRILLIDDVQTTGQASADAAKALKSAGARSISLWTLARTTYGCELYVAPSPRSVEETGTRFRREANSVAMPSAAT